MDTRNLIAIQDLEYEESLENDRKKEESKLKSIEDRLRIEENINVKREKLSVNRDGNIINLKFQLPTKNVTRIFTSKDTLQDLYDFIYIQDLGEDFKIYLNNPKRLLKNDNTTLDEDGIENMTKLYVYFDDL